VQLTHGNIFKEERVKRRIAIAAALAATLLGAAACNSSNDSDTPATSASGPVDGKGKTLKVWLMVDAQSGWPEVVADATARFTAATGAQVNVEYQQWANHLTKLDATLAGQDAPDVVELGNTEFAKYTFTGAFAELNKGDFENSSTWLDGLAGACDIEGKTYCVPYYAGARVLIYRKDLFEKSNLQPPKTYEDLLAAADKLKSDNSGDSKFAPCYCPNNWFLGGSYVKSEGGEIAIKEGEQWKAQLSSPNSQKGIQKWLDFFKKYSNADPAKDENDQAAIFSQGKAAFFYGNTWEKGAAEETKKDPNDPDSKLVKTKVFGKLDIAPMPSIPSFLGGSNLGVTEKSQNKELAAQWIKAFTDSKAMEGLIAKKALPNSTVMLDKAAQNADMEAAATAAKSSWFPPNSPKWADVEKATVMQTLFRDVLSGKKSPADAAAAADKQINTILNES
jgi:N,N'-diacetylchitobiose transport system substrate-binding protein